MVEAACRRGLPSVILCPPYITGAYSNLLLRIVRAMREHSFPLVEDGETVCENYLQGMVCGDFPTFPPSCYRRMGCRLDGMEWGPIETCAPGPCVYQSDGDGRFSSSCG